MTRNTNIGLALALIVFDAVYISQFAKLPVPFAQGEPGPAFLPILLSIVLMLSAVAILISALRTEDTEKEGNFDIVRPVLVMAATALLIILLYFLGYWIAALFYTFAIALIFEFSKEKPYVRSVGLPALLAVVLTVFGWLFFEKLFELTLPTGVI